MRSSVTIGGPKRSNNRVWAQCRYWHEWLGEVLMGLSTPTDDVFATTVTSERARHFARALLELADKADSMAESKQ